MSLRWRSWGWSLLFVAGLGVEAHASAVPTSSTADPLEARPVALGRARFTPGKGLSIETADGAFGLGARVRGQVRYSARPGGDSEAVHQFHLRRARIVFGGHFFGPKNRFKLELALSPNDLGLRDNLAADDDLSLPRRSPLLDLYFDFRVLRDLEVRVGQYKLPSNRTRVISSGNLQLVDRAIVNAEFTLDRDMGLDLRSRDLFGLGLLRYYAGVSIGRGRDSNGFEDLGLNYFVRLEVLPFGRFDDYSEVDLRRHASPRLSVGAAYTYQDRNPGLRRLTSGRAADGGTTDYHTAFFDALYKHAGFSAQVEAALRLGERNPGDALDADGAPVGVTPPRDGFGAMLQAGYLFAPVPVEIAARVGVVRAIGDPTETSLTDLTEIGGGLSWYFGGHAYKLQADVFRNFEARIEDGETLVRVQLQAGL